MKPRPLLPVTRDWYAHVFGFPEGGLDDTRKFVNHEAVCPAPNIDEITGLEHFHYVRHGEPKREVVAGAFQVLSVRDLRAKVHGALAQAKALGPVSTALDGKVTVTNQVGESRALHTLPELTGAVFQAASQFNCLEFASPTMTPENGIACYCDDRTQGPACALAGAAGTQFRQHGVQVPGSSHRGQSSQHQLNTLTAVEAVVLSRTGTRAPWTVGNGYIDADPAQLRELSASIDADPELKREMHDALQIGVQFDTEVTADFDPVAPPYFVTQTFNSAISVGYSRCTAEDWSVVGRLVLEASYEATFLVAVLNNCWRLLKQRPPRPLLLTKLGGGVFQNDPAWIRGAIEHGARAVAALGVALDCRIVHLSEVEEGYDEFVNQLLRRSKRAEAF